MPQLEWAFNSVFRTIGKHAACWTQGERRTIDLWLLVETFTELMLYNAKYSRIKSNLLVAIIFKIGFKAPLSTKEKKA